MRRTVLTGVVLLAVICLAETQLGQAEREIRRIVQRKNSAIKAAESLYAHQLEAADNQYEASINRAERSRAKAVSNANKLAVEQLSALAAKFTQNGALADSIEAYKTVYSFEPTNRQALEALRSAGVDLTSIPIETTQPPARAKSKLADQVVLWNTHNGKYNTSGTLECNLLLFSGNKEVWRAEKVQVPWKQDEDASVNVKLPPTPFTKVRVEVTKWQGYSGGLAEIQVWNGSVNLALGCPAKASASADRHTGPQRATDGVTTSSVYKDGYWLLPDRQTGWIEVDLAKHEQVSVVRTRVFASKQWQPVGRVFKGDVIDITATGVWRAAPKLLANANGGTAAGGDTHGLYRSRFYLRGRIGADVFKIGSKYTLKVMRDGILKMGMQEELEEWYTNNSGFLAVTLTYRRKSK